MDWRPGLRGTEGLLSAAIPSPQWSQSMCEWGRLGPLSSGGKCLGWKTRWIISESSCVMGHSHGLEPPPLNSLLYTCVIVGHLCFLK